VASGGDKAPTSTEVAATPSGGVAPAPASGESQPQQVVATEPRTIKQGSGDYAVVRFTEEDHKLVRKALDIAANELRGSKEGDRMRAIHQSLYEGF